MTKTEIALLHCVELAMMGERIVIASPPQADDEASFLIIKNEDPRAPYGTISEVIIKIVPTRIERSDQVDFLLSGATLDLLLSGDCAV
jgi:hypothetical protein